MSFQPAPLLNLTVRPKQMGLWGMLWQKNSTLAPRNCRQTSMLPPGAAGCRAVSSGGCSTPRLGRLTGQPSWGP